MKNKLDVSKESLARHVAAIQTKDGESRAQAFRAGKRPKLSPLSTDELRELAYAKGVPKEGSGLPGAWEPEHAQRVILVPWTDESIDSYNTIFDSRGWDFRAYEQNPVVFANHDAQSSPVPIGISLRIDATKLKGIDGEMREGYVSHVLISPEDLAPEADIILRNWIGGRVRGSSHSFTPVEASYAETKDIKRFKIPEDANLSNLLIFRKQSMNELSIVGLPANTTTTGRSQSPFVELEVVEDEPALTPEEDLAECRQRIVALEAKVADLIAIGERNQQEGGDGSREAYTESPYSEMLQIGAEIKARALAITAT